MNLSSFVGFIFATLVLYMGVFRTANDPLIFLDSHALILVIGGTVAATLISYPISRLLALGNFIIYGVILKRNASQILLFEEMRAENSNFRTGSAVGKSKYSHPFLSEALRTLRNNDINSDLLKEILKSRKLVFKKMYLEDAKILNAIAKYPPAFGLLGASTGMIAMMTNLGSGGTEKIGQAMAIALVATFWGIAATNFIILPLADYAQRSIQIDQNIRDYIIEGIMLMKNGASDSEFTISMKSKLDLSQRAEINRRAYPGGPVEEDSSLNIQASSETIVDGPHSGNSKKQPYPPSVGHSGGKDSSKIK